MLDEVLVANPGASVLCIQGPIGSSTAIWDTIVKVVTKYKADHPDVHMDTFMLDKAVDRASEEDGHPGPITSEISGKALAEKIKEFLGL